MKDRPIIFSGPMVRAILEGRKTQTRRVIKPQPTYSNKTGWTLPDPKRGYSVTQLVWSTLCPYGGPGDLLWVRETCRAIEQEDGTDGVEYLADGAFITIKNTPKAAEQWFDLHNYAGGRGRTVPSIHMPRWASRITLRITDVRVERVQNITTEDIIAEGLFTNLREHDAVCDLRDQWIALWDSINVVRGYGWDTNPWVWVVEFERVRND